MHPTMPQSSAQGNSNLPRVTKYFVHYALQTWILIITVQPPMLVMNTGYVTTLGAELVM